MNIKQGLCCIVLLYVNTLFAMPAVCTRDGLTFDGLLGTYYDQNNIPRAYFTGNTLERFDRQVNFNWGGGRPVVGFGTNDFSVVWEGRIEINRTGAYRFSTLSDDGVRLSINGEIIIDNFTDHAPYRDTGRPINLRAGEFYDIQMEFYELGGGAVAQLEWDGPGFSRQVIPASQLSYICEPPEPLPCEQGELETNGLQGNYYNQNRIPRNYFTGIVESRFDPQLNFNWGGGSPMRGFSRDDFSVTWEGEIEASESGAHTFSTVSDDGIRVYIDGNLIIDNFTDHAPRRDTSSPINLQAGNRYSINVEFYERGGGAVVQLEWSGPNFTRRIIPSANLFTQCPRPEGPDHIEVVVSGNASTCAAKDIIIRACDDPLCNSVFGDYEGTVQLSTSSLHGDWSLRGAGNLVSGAADSGRATFTFVTDNNGIASLQLNNQHAETLTITASDTINALLADTSDVIHFSDNAFVISDIDSLMDGVTHADVAIAGRDHLYRVDMVQRDNSQSPAVCAVANTYNLQQQPLKIWLNRQQLLAAVAPQINNVSLPDAKPVTSNIRLDFSAGGTATFALQSHDVGQFSIQVEDDSRVFANASDITGSSNYLTLRPFGIDIDFIVNGLEDRQTQGLFGESFAQNLAGLPDSNASVFSSAGSPFTAKVSAVQWQAADDLNNDGQVDSNANLSDNAATVSFGQEQSIESILISHTLAAPLSGSAGIIGGNLFSGFNNGSRSQTMTWSEVGIINLSARLSDNDYLASGMSLIGEAANVGRFIPHHFIVRSHPLISDPMVNEACVLGGFTYLGQNFTLNYELLASNLAGDVTENYTANFIKLDNSQGSLSLAAVDLTVPLNLLTRLPMISDINANTSYLWGPAMAVPLGVVEIETQLTIDRQATANGPYAVSMGGLPVDADGVSIEALDLDIDNDSVNDAAWLGDSQQRYGRVFLDNAFGPETRPLSMRFNAQYFNQAIGPAGLFIPNREDSCTAYSATNFSFVTGSYTQRLSSGETTISGVAASTYNAGFGSVTLSAPGNNNEGSVDVRFTVESFLRFDWDGDITTAESDPVNTASFGHYRGNDRIIYRREVSQ
jgi:MSHA biogenesis protein MshQ